MRAQRSILERSPTVDGSESRAASDTGACDTPFQRRGGWADHSGLGVVVDLARLGAAESDRETGRRRRDRICRIGQDGRVVSQLLESEAGDLAAPAATRAEGGHQDHQIAEVNESVGAAGAGESVENVAGDSALALATAGTSGGADREPKGRAEGRGGEWALEPAPAVQGRPAREAPADGIARVRAFGSQQAVGAQGVADVGRHAIAVVGFALNRVPKVVRHEFARQRLGGRPGRGRSRSRDRPQPPR